MATINEILATRQQLPTMRQKLAARPVRSSASVMSEMIQTPDNTLGYVKGGNLLSAIMGGLKSGLGFYGARQDRKAQEAYNQELAEQEAQDREQAEKLSNLGYYKLGINPSRLNEEGYLDAVLAKNTSDDANKVKGEFGYAMSIIQNPDFKNLPAEQQKLWIDFANTKARGLDNVYNQAYQNALGAGQGKLQTAQEIARQEAIGKQLLEQKPTGELTTMKGSPEDIKKEEKRTNYLNKMRSDFEKSDMILGYIDQALELLDKSPLASGYGSFLGQVNPYSDAGKLRSLLASIKGNVGLKQLIESKAEGATYGALSEKELQMLQDVMGKLDQFQNPAVLKQTLQNVRSNYDNVRERAFNALYGKPQESNFTQVSNEDLLKGL